MAACGRASAFQIAAVDELALPTRCGHCAWRRMKSASCGEKLKLKSLSRNRGSHASHRRYYQSNRTTSVA